MHGEFSNGNVFTFFQSRGQQCVWPPSSFFGNHVIRRFEEHGIYVARLHEFQNLHRLRRLGFDLLDLFRFHDYVFVLPILVALHNLAPFDYSILRRTVKLLLNPLQIIAVQHVEGDA